MLPNNIDHPDIVRPLFGGAITATMPHDLIDASDLRQVPDNQEVFMYPDSTASIVVEILGSVEPTEDKEAIRFHFDSLAHDNDATSQVLGFDAIENNHGDMTPSVIILHGTQAVKKFNSPTPDEVKVLMALYRVKEKNADLVVTFNVPLRSVDNAAVTEQQEQKAITDFENLVRSLRIIDFGLFA